MQKVIGFLLALAASGFGTISTLSIPHEIDSAAIPKVVYIDQNNDSIVNKVIEVIDTMNLYVPGGGTFTGTALSSTGNLRFTIDSDANATGACVSITHNGTTDTIAKFCDDLASRFYGAVTGTNLSLSGTATVTDSLILTAATASRLLATGAGKQAASVSDLTSWIAGTANQITSTSDGDGTLTLSLPQNIHTGASPTFAGGTFTGAATMSSTLGVTGLQSNSEAIAFTANGTGGAGRIYRSATNGLAIRGVTGSTNDFALIDAANNTIARNPTGTTDMVFHGLLTASSGASFTGGTSGAGKIWTGATSGLNLQGITGGTNDFALNSAAGSIILRNPTGTTGLSFPTAPTFESVTASQFLLVDGSKALTSVGATGSGSVVRATSPTISGLTLSGTTATGLTASRTLITDGSGNMAVNTETGTGSHVRATSPTISGLTLSGTTATGLTASRTLITDGSGNMSVNTETGTGSHVRAISPTLVTPALGDATATTIALGGNEAFTYNEGSFTFTATGMTTSPTGTAAFTRFGSGVILSIPAIVGTSNATTFTLTGLPAEIIPASANQACRGVCQDAGVEANCTVRISTAGAVTLLIEAVNGGTTVVPYSSGWTNSGIKGTDPFSCAYNIQ